MKNALVDYLLDGELYCVTVHSWDQFFAETFNPDCKILKIAEPDQYGWWENSYIAPDFHEVMQQFK